MTAEDQALVKQLEQLPRDYWDFRDADTKELVHGIHNYPATMVCPISRNIIRIVQSIRPVDSLLDPFCGSGTVVVEGMLSGIPNVGGNDINPLALMLTRGKTTRLDITALKHTRDTLIANICSQRTELAPILEEVDSYIADILDLDLAASESWGNHAPQYLHDFCQSRGVHLDVPDFKNMGYWFRPRVILELAIIKENINAISDEDMRRYILIALSETLRIVSNRRNGEFKMYRMTAEKVRAFQPDVFGEFLDILNRNVEKMGEFCCLLDQRDLHPNVTVYQDNSCSLASVPDNFYSLIITSPPYGDSRTTVAYGQYSRLSLQWIDQFALSDKEITGLDRTLMGGRKLQNGFACTLPSETLRAALERIMAVDMERAGEVFSFYLDLDAAIQKCADKTRLGGYQFWVVGNRTVKDVQLMTDVIITELARQYGMVHLYTIARNIPNKVMPLRNCPTNIAGNTNATMTNEHIVVLKKE